MRSPIKAATMRGRAQSVLVADLVGRRITGEVGHEMVIDLEEPPAPDLLDPEAHYRHQLPYVERTLAPVGLSLRGRDADLAVLDLRISDYARFCAAADYIAALSSEALADLVTRSHIGTPTSLSHSLGVNCTLETADGQLIWTRRNGTTAVGPGALNVAMSEGSSPIDLSGSAWDPEVTVRRGLFEELGFPRSSALPLDVAFHSLICQLDNGGLSLLAHVRTQFTAAELEAMAAAAADRNERDGHLIFTPSTFAAVEDFLAANIDSPWTSWSSASILGLMRLRFPDEVSKYAGWTVFARTATDIPA